MTMDFLQMRKAFSLLQLVYLTILCIVVLQISTTAEAYNASRPSLVQLMKPRNSFNDRRRWTTVNLMPIVPDFKILVDECLGHVNVRNDIFKSSSMNSLDTVNLPFDDEHDNGDGSSEAPPVPMLYINVPDLPPVGTRFIIKPAYRGVSTIHEISTSIVDCRPFTTSSNSEEVGLVTYDPVPRTTSEYIALFKSCFEGLSWFQPLAVIRNLLDLVFDIAFDTSYIVNATNDGKIYLSQRGIAQRNLLPCEAPENDVLPDEINTCPVEQVWRWWKVEGEVRPGMYHTGLSPMQQDEVKLVADKSPYDYFVVNVGVKFMAVRHRIYKPELQRAATEAGSSFKPAPEFGQSHGKFQGMTPREQSCERLSPFKTLYMANFEIIPFDGPLRTPPIAIYIVVGVIISLTAGAIAVKMLDRWTG